MRRRIFSLGLILIFFATTVIAQSLTVHPRKVVYKRTAKTVPDFKRSFVVRYPVFSGAFKPAVLRELRIATDYWKVFKISLAENLKDDHWLTSLDYKVAYNKNGVLDIALAIEGLGAYPDGSTEHLVFDLRKGRLVTYDDIFASAMHSELVQTIREVMKRKEDDAVKESEDVRDVLEDYRRTEPEHYPSIDKVGLKDLDGFSVSDKGITFFYDYKFAHVVQALEPFDEIFIPYSDLKSFIRRDGLLARFVR